MESEELDSEELMEDGEEVVEEDTEDILGYLTTPWLLDLLLGERPLLQVGLSEPRRRDGRRPQLLGGASAPGGAEEGGRPTGGVEVRVGGAVVGAEQAGVALLGLGRVRAQAAHLPVRAVHHLHKLATPAGAQAQRPVIATATASRCAARMNVCGSATACVMEVWKVMRTHFNRNRRLGLCSRRPGYSCWVTWMASPTRPASTSFWIPVTQQRHAPVDQEPSARTSASTEASGHMTARRIQLVLSAQQRRVCPAHEEPQPVMD